MANKSKPNFRDPNVKEKFNSLPPAIREKLFFIRQLIFDLADELKEVGELEETLKWNEPSYSPIKPRVGSPIRINWIKNSNNYGVYFNCQSNLVPTFKQIYPEAFSYTGNRGIIFSLDKKIPITKLKHCLSLALTYHLNKRQINPINK